MPMDAGQHFDAAASPLELLMMVLDLPRGFDQQHARLLPLGSGDFPLLPASFRHGHVPCVEGHLLALSLSCFAACSQVAM